MIASIEAKKATVIVMIIEIFTLYCVSIVPGFADAKWDKAVTLLNNPSTRHEGIKALREVGESAVPELKKAAFDNKEDNEIRSIALYRLAKLKRKEQRQDIEKCLLSDEQFQIRSAASNALAELGETDSLPVLRKALKEDTNGTSRMYAALALVRMGDRSVRISAEEAITANDVNAQIVAVQVLEEIGDKSRVPYLKSQAHSSNNKWNQLHLKQAAYAIELKDLQDQARLEYLKNILYSENALLMQKWAAARIAAIETPGAYEFLITLHNDPKCAAHYAIGRVLERLQLEGKLRLETPK